MGKGGEETMNSDTLVKAKKLLKTKELAKKIIQNLVKNITEVFHLAFSLSITTFTKNLHISIKNLF